MSDTKDIIIFDKTLTPYTFCNLYHNNIIYRIRLADDITDVVHVRPIAPLTYALEISSKKYNDNYIELIDFNYYLVNFHLTEFYRKDLKFVTIDKEVKYAMFRIDDEEYLMVCDTNNSDKFIIFELVRSGLEVVVTTLDNKEFDLMLPKVVNVKQLLQQIGAK